MWKIPEKDVTSVMGAASLWTAVFLCLLLLGVAILWFERLSGSVRSIARSVWHSGVALTLSFLYKTGTTFGILSKPDIAGALTSLTPEESKKFSGL